MSILNVPFEWHKPEPQYGADGKVDYFLDTPDPELADEVFVALPNGEVIQQEFGEIEGYDSRGEWCVGACLNDFAWDEIDAWAYLPKHPTKKAEETK